MGLRQLLTPSFRARLRLFFVVIVVFPMITIAVVLYQLIVASESSQTDARLSESQTVALEIYEEGQKEAGRVADQIGSDQQLADALGTDDRRAVERRLETLTRRADAQHAVLQIEGKGPFQSGTPPGVATATRDLVDADQNPTGAITVAMFAPDEYARRISQLTGSEVVIESGDEQLASTQADVGSGDLPEDGPVEIAGVEYRVASFPAPVGEESITVSLLMPDRDTASPTSEASLAAAAAFVGFLALAFAFAVAVSRRLQSEIQRLLEAAQRLGSGDFSVEVPADGNDEFAALGKEFN